MLNIICAKYDIVARALNVNDVVIEATNSEPFLWYVIFIIFMCTAIFLFMKSPVMLFVLFHTSRQMYNSQSQA